MIGAFKMVRKGIWDRSVRKLRVNDLTPVKKQALPPYSEQLQDEIDLVDLLRSLWRGRWLIGAITLVALLAALAYIYLTPVVYRSTAVFTPPAMQQVRSMVSWELENYPITPELVFEEFRSKLNADQVRLEFFEQQFVSPEQRAGLSEGAFIQQYRQFLKQLEVKLSGPKDAALSVTVSLDGLDPLVASENLRKFTTVANQAALQALKENFESVRASKMAELKSKMDALKFQAQRQREMRLQELSEALAIAQSLGLKESRMLTPSYDAIHVPGRDGAPMQMISPPLYWHGIDELKAQIDAIRSVDYAFYQAVELPKLESQYRHVRSANVVIDQGLSYTEQQAPLPDFHPVKPRRALVVALALVAGLMVGVMVALIRSAFIRRAPQDSSAI